MSSRLKARIRDTLAPVLSTMRLADSAIGRDVNEGRTDSPGSTPPTADANEQVNRDSDPYIGAELDRIRG
jgi:hypothetical protein